MDSLNALIAGGLHELAGYSKKSLKQSDFPECMNNIPVPEHMPKMNAGYTCIFNWRNMCYLFVSDSIENILGYDKNQLLKHGFKFSISIIHPDDSQRLKELHKAIFNYYYNTPVFQRCNLRFSYNFRVKTADNEYVHLLRQSTFINNTDEGKPTFEFITATDITGFRSNNDIILTIHKLTPNGLYGLCYQTRFSEQYNQLSNRERQVLELARQGYTTKEIADKLYLSVETVKSHRKHIIAKTGSGNMIEATNMQS